MRKSAPKKKTQRQPLCQPLWPFGPDFQNYDLWPRKNGFQKLEISLFTSKGEETQWSTLAKWLITCCVVVIFTIWNMVHFVTLIFDLSFDKNRWSLHSDHWKKEKYWVFKIEFFRVNDENLENLTFVKSKLGQTEYSHKVSSSYINSNYIY